MQKQRLLLLPLLCLLSFSTKAQENTPQDKCTEPNQTHFQNKIAKVKYQYCVVDEDDETVTIQLHMSPKNGGIEMRTPSDFKLVVQTLYNLNYVEKIEMPLPQFNDSDVILSKPFQIKKEVTIDGNTFRWNDDKRMWDDPTTGKYRLLYIFILDVKKV